MENAIKLLVSFLFAILLTAVAIVALLGMLWVMYGIVSDIDTAILDYRSRDLQRL